MIHGCISNNFNFRLFQMIQFCLESDLEQVKYIYFFKNFKEFSVISITLPGSIPSPSQVGPPIGIRKEGPFRQGEQRGGGYADRGGSHGRAAPRELACSYPGAAINEHLTLPEEDIQR